MKAVAGKYVCPKCGENIINSTIFLSHRRKGRVSCPICG